MSATDQQPATTGMPTDLTPLVAPLAHPDLCAPAHCRVGLNAIGNWLFHEGVHRGSLRTLVTEYGVTAEIAVGQYQDSTHGLNGDPFVHLRTIDPDGDNELEMWLTPAEVEKLQSALRWALFAMDVRANGAAAGPSPVE